MSAETGNVSGLKSWPCLCARQKCDHLGWIKVRWSLPQCTDLFFPSRGSFLACFAPFPLFTCLPQGSQGKFSLIKTFAHNSVLFSTTGSGKSDLLLSVFSTKNWDPRDPALGSSLHWILPLRVQCTCLGWKQRRDFLCKPLSSAGCIRFSPGLQEKVFSLSCRHSAA